MKRKLIESAEDRMILDACVKGMASAIFMAAHEGLIALPGAPDEGWTVEVIESKLGYVVEAAIQRIEAEASRIDSPEAMNGHIPGGPTNQQSHEVRVRDTICGD